MPNWCDNKVTIRGPLTELRQLADWFSAGKLFHNIKPTPAELLDNYPFGDPRNEQRKKDTGYESWYDWRLEHWGTKWDVGPTDGTFLLNEAGTESSIDGRFLTAWSPPIMIYHALIRLGFDVSAYWYEPGMDLAGGYVNDGCGGHAFDIEIPASSEDCKAQLPAELLDAFPIVEMKIDSENDR